MRQLLFIILTFVNAAVYGQLTPCEQKLKTLLIDKISAYRSNDLIPYYSEADGMWGFFHRKTKEVLTTAVLSSPYFFKPNLRFSYSFQIKGTDGCHGLITGSTQSYRIEYIKKSEMFGSAADGVWSNSKAISYTEFVKPSIEGFEVDSAGKLTFFNPRFYDEEKDKPKITHVFKFKDQYYAFVYTKEISKGYYSIINQNGIAFKGFENLPSYPLKKQTYSNEKDVWFLIETDKDKYVFRSLFKNKQLKETIGDSPNWVYDAQSFGYAIFVVGDKKGVLDLTTMKWLIPPAKRNDFLFLHYTYLEPLQYNYDKKEHSYDPNIEASIAMIKANRKNAYIYIQNSKNQFMDLNLKLYKPIE